MRVIFKRILRAFVPYGFVVLYRRSRSTGDNRQAKHSEQKEAKKKFIELIATARKIEKHDNPKVIVSLTSYGHRIKQTAPLAIATLFNQTLLPDKVIIWLAHGDKASPALRKLEKYGLYIKYTDDLKSYKKLIPTLEENPDSTIITVDDDMLYPKTWLEKTMKTHHENPKAVVFNRGKKIIIKNGQIEPYTSWPLLTEEVDSHLMLPTGAGGVLYPPDSLDNRVLDRALYMNLAPHADDLWFWAMTELKNTNRVLVKEGFRDTIEYELDNANNNRLSILNIDPSNSNNNDTQFAKILDHFPELHTNLKNIKTD